MHLTPNRLIEDDAARKVLLMGDYGVGKTAFGQRVCDAFTHGNLYAKSCVQKLVHGTFDGMSMSVRV